MSRQAASPTWWIIDFDNGVPLGQSEKKRRGNPKCVYFVCERHSAKPIYVGEFGKATGYSVATRIGAHFKSGTLARVTTNLRAFEIPVPSKVRAFVVRLDGKFANEEKRKSLEAWVIRVVCHERKIQDARFAVIRSQLPKQGHRYATLARTIVAQFERLASRTE